MTTERVSDDVMAPVMSHSSDLAVRSPNRLPSLTGLRFIAALAVFGFHCLVGGLGDTGWVGSATHWVFGPGAAGVSFFFILSGFVLTWSARPVDTPVRFWRRRLAKIYPNHFATMIVALVLALATGAAVTAGALLANVLLLQAWIPTDSVYYGLNTVSWSLACEMFFYALFPLLYRGLGRVGARWLWRATVASLGLVWLIPVLARLVAEPDRYWAIWIFPVARLPEFVSGMLLARIVRLGRWPVRFGFVPAAILALVAYLGSRFVPDDFRIVAVTVAPLALLVAAVGAADATGRWTPWRSRPMVWLGEISYAFYLVHLLVLRVVTSAAGNGHPAIVEVGIALGALILAVVSSWLLHRFVELPGMRLLGSTRRLRSRRAIVPSMVVRPMVDSEPLREESQ